MMSDFHRLAATAAVCVWLAAVSWPCGADAGTPRALSPADAVKLAVDNHPTMNEALEHIEKARQEMKSARADFLPKATAAYSYTSLDETPYMSGLGMKINVAHNDLFHWNVTLAQPLFTGFALKNRYELSQLGVRAAETERRRVRLDLTEQVTTAYFNVLQSEKFCRVANEAVQNLTSHEADAEKFYREGLIPYNDLLKARVALANARQEKEKATAGVLVARSALNILLNQDLNQPIILEDTAALPPVTESLEALIATALEHRPELQLLELALRQSDEGIQLARSAFYPTVSLAARYEQTGKNAEADINDYSNRYNSSIRLQAEWTFFEWGKTRADVSVRRHRKKSVREKFNDVKNQVRLQTKDALATLQVAGKNIQTAKIAMEQAKENWRITQLQYRQHIASSTDVLDARTFLTQAQTNHYNALYGYLISLGRLERAVGRQLHEP